MATNAQQVEAPDAVLIHAVERCQQNLHAYPAGVRERHAGSCPLCHELRLNEDLLGALFV